MRGGRRDLNGYVDTAIAIQITEESKTTEMMLGNQRQIQGQPVPGAD